MKRSILLLIKICLLFVFVANVNLLSQTATPPAAGDGTTGNPYQIQTIDNLYWLSQNSNEWDKNYIQTANIDATATSGWDGGAGFSPIGNFSVVFNGSYKGYVFKITNLTINRPGTSYVGLFGYASVANIENVGIENVNITGLDYVGGLIGASGSMVSISNSYTTGSVTGNNKVGGLAGYCSSYSSIMNCYSVVNVTGNNYIGGLSGDLTIVSDIFNSYSAGNVSGTGADVGGLIGRNLDAKVTNSFWDTETSGQATSAGGTGKTTAEMKNSGTYGVVGWDFSLCWIRADVVNDGYPFLLAPILPSSEPPSTGDGTSDNPYSIETLDNLVWLSQNSDQWDKHYMQVADIDAGASFTDNWYNGYGFSPIGTTRTSFTGIYNGNNHSISNLYIYRPVNTRIGLFGNIYYCTIENLGVENITLTGKENVGGLVGYNFYSSILNCYSTGNVSGNARVGGLVGDNDGSTIASSYSAASVDGGWEVGGLAGFCADALITNSYSTGSITGDGSLGGLVGTTNSSVINSFWDTETSGMATSAGGTGKTTAEMKTQSTFTDTGWDFTYCWSIDGASNNGYPFLQEPIIPESVPPSSGDGSAENPWEIQTLENLVWLSQTSSQWNKHFIQTADIDAAPSRTEGWYNGYGFSPIGSKCGLPPYRGTYNGNNHTIINLYINRLTNSVGLFGYAYLGTIKNLVVENADITGSDNVGAIAGEAMEMLIRNCYSTGSVEGNNTLGGLAGVLSYSSIMNSYSTVSVNGNKNVGGLAGYSALSGISKSFAAGNVQGNTNVGGIVGVNAEASLINCYSIAEVSGTIDNIGGLVGSNYSSTINNCYSAGNVTGISNVGGLAGVNDAQITNSFWDTESSGQATSAGGTGISTTEMKDVVTYTDTNTVGLDIAWDFKGNPYNDTTDENIWNIIGLINDGYPCLRWELNDIITQPVGQTMCSGENVILTVLAGGIDITYQWKKDDVNIAGETSDSLALNNVDTEDDGLYTCLVISDYDTLTSETADLTILAATSIATQPVNQNVHEGEDVWITTTASGVNLMYHWIKDGTSYMLPCNCPTIFISAVSVEDEGQYTCVVTGDCGEETSQAATLSIATNEVITTNTLTNDFHVFPNPTDGLITVEYPEGSKLLEKSQIIITDITGTVIAEKQWSGDSNRFVITDLSIQPDGMYFIKICNSMTAKVIKIMKE